MLFSTLTFLFYFLPIFLIVYHLLPETGASRNIWFLAASLLFYFWGEPAFVFVLLTSIFINYFCGRLINGSENSIRKWALFVGVGVNLLIMLYFKYSLFLVENVAGIWNDSWRQSTWAQHFKSIYLPLGISFFTFQSISYLVDVYRKEAEVEKNLINLACYISMFPQLVAGPIVRYKSIATQIKKRKLLPSEMTFGVVLFVTGLAYKILLANILAEPVDRIFDLSNSQITPALAWAASLGYTYQIYFDFCGYSTMAVGLGLMLGFHFPHNFNFPYVAVSITDFWRRWHITLSSWFRDYFYIPLGGNRNGDGRTYFNLFLVFVCCGLWHGAAWNFLFWGIYHGAFLVLERIGLGKILNKMPRPIGVLYTMIVVIIGWVFFRASSFEQALIFLKAMMGISPESAVKFYVLAEFINPVIILVFLMAVFLATPVFNQLFLFDENKRQTICQLRELPRNKLGIIWYAIIAGSFMFCYLFLVNQSYNPFIYFRF